MRVFIVEAMAIVTAAINPVFHLFITRMTFAAFFNCRDRYIRAFFRLCFVMAIGTFFRTMLGMGKA